MVRSSSPPVIQRSQLKLVERLGRGRWGEVHLCHLASAPGSSLVTVQSLEPVAPPEQRAAFHSQARSLASLRSPHLVALLGTSPEDPPLLVAEAGDMGDLNQWLQQHVAESSLSCSPGVASLSYPALMHLATQIASGLRALESVGLVHRDLATRCP